MDPLLENRQDRAVDPDAVHTMIPAPNAVDRRAVPANRDADWGDLLEDDTDEEEIVVLQRSVWPGVVFAAVGVLLVASAVGLVVISLPTSDVATATTGEVGSPVASTPLAPAPVAAPELAAGTGSAAVTAAAAPTTAPPRVIAPIEPAPPPEIGGEGERKPRRWSRRVGAVAKPPPLSVSALPALSVSSLPPAE